MSKRIRQRQGRDFSILDYLRSADSSAAEGGYKITGSRVDLPGTDESARKSSLLELLEQMKGTAADQDTPVDGHEPPGLDR